MIEYLQNLSGEKQSMRRKIKILYLASEADPLVKVGGLGDVAGSLPPALHALGGVDIRLVIPDHGNISRDDFVIKPAASFDVPHALGPLRADVRQTQVQGLTAYLVGGGPIAAYAHPYSADNAADGHKYTFFSLAALELARELDWEPDVLHANDWHTAPAVYALRLRSDPFFARTKTILSVHNLPYLGIGAGEAMNGFGLPPAIDSPLPWWAQNLPLPVGLHSADAIVAVSPTYALEILTPEFGSGLDDYLKTRSDTITGILNGINLERWDPQTDTKLAAQFSADSLERRAQNKTALLQELGLNPDPAIPLLGMVTRMDPQKGVDLLPGALDEIADLDWNFVILGMGMPAMEEVGRQIELRYPERVRAAIRFDASLSRHIYAGADMLLIPSRYEPCGLAQMIAMRYGCVPVARATGGLRDTIRDAADTHYGTGFLFLEASADQLAKALRRAVRLFSDQDAWRRLQLNGMAQDFSWERFARQYLELYRSLAGLPAGN